MPKTFGELNLRKIRDEVGLDFAHFTYKKGMCSCCYRPYDLPALYWKGKSRKEKDENREKAKMGADYTFILFNHADNGNGIVKRNEYLCFPFKDPDIPRNFGEPCREYIKWAMTEEQLDQTCKLLQAQLGSEYRVIKPEDENKTISIEYVGKVG